MNSPIPSYYDTQSSRRKSIEMDRDDPSDAEASKSYISPDQKSQFRAAYANSASSGSTSTSESFKPSNVEINLDDFEAIHASELQESLKVPEIISLLEEQDQEIASVQSNFPVKLTSSAAVFTLASTTTSPITTTAPSNSPSIQMQLSEENKREKMRETSAVELDWDNYSSYNEYIDLYDTGVVEAVESIPIADVNPFQKEGLIQY